MEEEHSVQEGDASTGVRDPERFYCPHVGCNRSFAELWRLKVHYRAPPDVRGSGKERGHGTELAFCPKCGKDLKPGKHHVGCSASKSTQRQTKRRQDEVGLDAGAQQMQLAKYPSLDQNAASQGKEHHQQQQQQQQQMEFPALTPGAGLLIHGGMPSPSGQHPVASYYICVPGPNGVPIWQGPVIAGHPAGPMGFQHPPFTPLAAPGAAFPPQPNVTAVGLSHMSMPGIPNELPTTSAAMQPMLAGNEQPKPMGHEPASHEPIGNGLLGGIFDDDVLDLTRIPSPPPLPPDFSDSEYQAPGGGMLFNFGQFSHKMPSSQPVLVGSNQLVKDLTQEALDLAEANVVYESQDDGDLMQLLFGIADEAPTMATIHLHKFPSRASIGPDSDDNVLSEYRLGHREGQAEAHSDVKAEPSSQSAQQQEQQQQQKSRSLSCLRRASTTQLTAPNRSHAVFEDQPAVKHEDASLQQGSQQVDNGQPFALSGHDPPNGMTSASHGPGHVKAEPSEQHPPDGLPMLRGLFSDSPCPSPYNETTGLFSF